MSAARAGMAHMHKAPKKGRQVSILTILQTGFTNELNRTMNKKPKQLRPCFDVEY